MKFRPTNLAVTAVVVALGLFALGGVIFVSADSGEGLERLGMLFGFLGLLVTTIVSLYRSDTNHQALNGSFDARIKRIVLDANATRRSTDTETPEG
jgi:hypothetical protein